MRILGHGIDAVEVSRIAEMLARHDDRFLTRVYTPNEIAYASKAKRRDEHLAARFAAKEATLKALGTGWANGIEWTEIEVVLLPSGQPTIVLRGKAREVALGQGITAWSVSLTHTSEMAFASVIASGE
jgi:holo-[acyl-carrier protein] synthase